MGFTEPQIEPRMWTDAFHMSRKGFKTIEVKNRDGTILTYINDSKQKEQITLAAVKKYRDENIKSQSLEEQFEHQTTIDSKCSYSSHYTLTRTHFKL